MCLAVPAKVLSLDNGMATVDMIGLTTVVDASLLDGITIGDYVMVHAGFAIERYNEQEARITLDLIEEMVRLDAPPR